MKEPVENVDLVIAINTDVSSATSLQDRYLVGLITPSTLDSTSITVQASSDAGATFTDFYDRDGVQYSINVGADRHVLLDPGEFAGMNYVKFVTSTSETAARTITLVKRKI